MNSNESTIKTLRAIRDNADKEIGKRIGVIDTTEAESIEELTELLAWVTLKHTVTKMIETIEKLVGVL